MSSGSVAAQVEPARLSVRPARKKMVEILGDPAVQGCRVRAVRTDVPPATRAGIGVTGGLCGEREGQDVANWCRMYFTTKQKL